MSSKLSSVIMAYVDTTNLDDETVQFMQIWFDCVFHADRLWFMLHGDSICGRVEHASLFGYFNVHVPKSSVG